MTGTATGVPPELVRAREAYARRAWDDAYQLFSAVDRGSPLGREDLARYSWAAGLSGRDRELLTILERIYQLVLDDDPQMAARVGFWLGYRLNGLGELGQASGWFARVERLLEREGKPCVISGYLRLPETMRQLAQNECDAAFASAARRRGSASSSRSRIWWPWPGASRAGPGCARGTFARDWRCSTRRW